MTRAASVWALVAVVLFLGSACAEASSESSFISLSGAEWRGGGSGEGDLRILASGEWSKGMTTPPTCSLIESPSSEESVRFDRVKPSLDGDEFRVEFPRNLKINTAPAELDPRAEYRVECRVNTSTAKPATSTTPVEGAPLSGGSPPGSTNGGGQA